MRARPLGSGLHGITRNGPIKRWGIVVHSSTSSTCSPRSEGTEVYVMSVMERILSMMLLGALLGWVVALMASVSVVGVATLYFLAYVSIAGAGAGAVVGLVAGLMYVHGSKSKH